MAHCPWVRLSIKEVDLGFSVFTAFMNINFFPGPVRVSSSMRSVVATPRASEK